jgi:hypothetical protein
MGSNPILSAKKRLLVQEPFLYQVGRTSMPEVIHQFTKTDIITHGSSASHLNLRVALHEAISGLGYGFPLPIGDDSMAGVMQNHGFDRHLL